MYVSSGPTPDEKRWRRWETDRSILHERFPNVQHLVVAGTNTARATGIVDVDAGGGLFEPVKIEMIFSDRYPTEPPRVLERGGRWDPSPARHIEHDHGLCLGLPGVDLPTTATAEDFAYFLDQLLVFLHDQFIFDATQKWPGQDWDHYLDGYVQFVAETLDIRTPEQAHALGNLVSGALPSDRTRCPCGSRMPFGRCHKARVERARAVPQLRRVRDLAWRLEQRTYAA